MWCINHLMVTSKKSVKVDYLWSPFAEVVLLLSAGTLHVSCPDYWAFLASGGVRPFHCGHAD
jgi:hypothetical protein